MTYGQLFREVCLELHPGQDQEVYFKYADTVAPSKINVEVPEDQVEMLRQEFLAVGRMIDSRSDEENNRELNKFLGNN